MPVAGNGRALRLVGRSSASPPSRTQATSSSAYSGLPAAARAISISSAEAFEVLDTAVDVAGVEAAPVGTATSRTLLEQLRPGEEADNDRALSRQDGQRVEQVEQGRFGPVDVVDDHDERLLARGFGEEPGDRLRRLVPRRRSLGHAEQLRDPWWTERAGLAGGALVADPGQLADDLRDRPVGDALTVGEARSAQDRRPIGYPGRKLGDESRLADPGVADDGDEPKAGGRRPELALEPRELVLTAPERARGRRGRAVWGGLPPVTG